VVGGQHHPRRVEEALKLMGEIVLSSIGGLFLIGGALIAYFGTRGKTRADAKAAADARIDHRMDTELSRIYTRVDTLEAELESVTKRLTTAETAIGLAERQAVEMIHHIIRLEQMIPNPPGPPARPQWKLPLLGERDGA
jgi:hypothetical protein